MQHTHTHKALTGHVEAKTLLSRRRQSNYSIQKLEHNGFIFDYIGLWGEDYTHNLTQFENCRSTENNRDLKITFLAKE